MYGRLVGHESMWDNVDRLSAAASGPPSMAATRTLDSLGQNINMNTSTANAPVARSSMGQEISATMDASARIATARHNPISPDQRTVEASMPRPVGLEDGPSAYIQPNNSGYGAVRRRSSATGVGLPSRELYAGPLATSGSNPVPLRMSDYRRPNTHNINADRDLSRML